MNPGRSRSGKISPIYFAIRAKKIKYDSVVLDQIVSCQIGALKKHTSDSCVVIMLPSVNNSEYIQYIVQSLYM